MRTEKTLKAVLAAATALTLVLGMSGSAYAATSDPLRIQAARWWQWAVSVPLDGTHPLEGSANDCMTGQSDSGPIYLGGVFNSDGSEERTCTIPVGRPIFAPTVNVECSTVEPDPFHGNTGAELKACSQGWTLVGQHAELDGVALTVHRITSPVFPFTVGDTWTGFFGASAGTQARSVSTGGHIWIPGLTPGDHELRIEGTIQEFDWTITVLYHLHVV